ncbi:MAG: hypothetical protein K0R38_6266 [Polyangiaceae bacterium]|nr:hypothetical protein [Polyangiaceae bacterium]
MVGVHVRVYGVAQAEPELSHQLDVALDVLQHGVDDDGFARLLVRQQVGVSRGVEVVELSQQHDSSLQALTVA